MEEARTESEHLKKEEGDEEEEEKSKYSKDCIKRFFTMVSNYKTLAYGVTVFVYLIIGGAIFMALERPNEVRQNDQLIADNASYFEQYQLLVDFLVNSTSLNETEAVALVINISNLAVAANSVQESSNWIYVSAFFFCMTVVTTIGYGAVAPVTRGGRAFFTPYAIVGIPIALVFLAALGNDMKRMLQFTLKFCVKPEHMKRPTTRALIVFITTLIGLVFMAFIPAVLFSVIEGWTYSESLYYTFVTMTTVGFGDFVPSVLGAGFYRVCVGGWIFVSLAFLALIIGEIQDFLGNFNVMDVMRKVKRKKDGGETVSSQDGDEEIPETPVADKS